LEKLKQRRAEREKEQRMMEQERVRREKEQEQMTMGDWQAKEDEFHLRQAKARAQIRMKQGRAKPIDILAMNLR
jgi:hypothetical protein